MLRSIKKGINKHDGNVWKVKYSFSFNAKLKCYGKMRKKIIYKEKIKN